MTDCVHHWIIEAANGPNSNGVCRHCGAGREFHNWTDSPIGITLEDGKIYRWRDMRIRAIENKGK